MYKDIFDSLTLENLFIDGRPRNSLVEDYSLEKWFITRTKSRLIIGMAILGYSILAKSTKPSTSRKLGRGPDEDGL
jgi:hypothetical protein